MTDYKVENNTIDIINPQGTAANTNVSGVAEFAADFQARLSSLVKASLSRRPDSIALDYLTAFCLGPIAIADTSSGVVPFVWMCRIDNDTRQVFIARENDTKDNWLAESELFTFNDGLAGINEVDIAFTQNGRPVVCASRNTGLGGSTEVWLYWFDSTDSTFGFDNFGAGRTPRVILDSPFDISNSDVLFFYLSTTKLVYRQQQDRYINEIETPLAVDSNTYIEDVVKLRSGRIRVELIKRNAITGKYITDELTSTLYPVLVGPDNLTSALAFIDAELIVAIIDITLADIDELDSNLLFISAALTEPVITKILFDIDGIDPSFTFTSGTMVVVVIEKVLYDKDELDAILGFSSASIIQVVITHTLFDISEIDPSMTFINATMEVV